MDAVIGVGMAAVVNADGGDCEQCRTQDHVERDGCARDERELAACRAQFHDAMAVSTLLLMRARAQRTGGVGRQRTKAEEEHATKTRAAAQVANGCVVRAETSRWRRTRSWSRLIPLSWARRSSVRFGALRSVRAKKPWCGAESREHAAVAGETGSGTAPPNFELQRTRPPRHRCAGRELSDTVDV